MRTRSIWLPILALAGMTGGHAQELLTTDDGVSLHGTVRLLQGNAAGCNVIAGNEQGRYEEMRVNQDQPLHLWELEFSVFNGSGRALDHLIAYYHIVSPWPPCTNWTEHYELGAEYQFIQVQWVDPSGRIQHTGAATPTLPNQTHTETILLLAFNGVRPQFFDWSVNYTFLDGEVGSSRVSTGAPPALAAPAAVPPPASAPPALQAGQSYSDPLSSGGQGPEMVVIPSGRFQMGCVSGRYCRSADLPVHEVTIPQAFAVSKYEVTFEEWDRCVAGGGCGGYRPNDEGWGRGRRPVINVSWDDSHAYVAWLSRQTGQTYRLLSEAEWEYVARASSSTAYSWGNDIGSNRANCEDCGSQWDNRQTAPAGSFAANTFGVHDMHGNVWEWVEDCRNDSCRRTGALGAAESVACACCVAVPGSTTRGTCAPRSATGSPPGSGTTSTASALPGRSILESLHLYFSGDSKRAAAPLVPAVERFPRNRKFLLGDRIQSTALDVRERRIEATYTKRRTNHLAGANLGIENLRFLFRLAHDLRAIDRRRYEHAARMLASTVSRAEVS